jgi:hypothetical protein
MTPPPGTGLVARRERQSPQGRSGPWIVDGNQLCFGITVKNLGAAPTAGHVHGPARPNQDTAIVVPPTAPTSPEPGAGPRFQARETGVACSLRHCLDVAIVHRQCVGSS